MNYINNKQIILSEKSKSYNNHTWDYDGGVYQLDAIEFFYSKIINENDFCILDIGSQSGSYTLLSKFCEKTVWYSFEPDPKSFDCLLENLKLNKIGNVNAFNIGISDVSEIKKLNVCKNHSGLNTFGEGILNFNSENTETIEVTVKTIDELFLQTKVDLIKIDTEGCEFNVINGAKKVIKKYKPKIFLEYYDLNLRQFNKTIDDLNILISDIGYKITWSKDDNVLIEPK